MGAGCWSRGSLRRWPRPQGGPSGGTPVRRTLPRRHPRRRSLPRTSEPHEPWVRSPARARTRKGPCRPRASRDLLRLSRHRRPRLSIGRLVRARLRRSLVGCGTSDPLPLPPRNNRHGPAHSPTAARCCPENRRGLRVDQARRPSRCRCPSDLYRKAAMRPLRRWAQQQALREPALPRGRGTDSGIRTERVRKVLTRRLGAALSAAPARAHPATAHPAPLLVWNRRE